VTNKNGTESPSLKRTDSRQSSKMGRNEIDLTINNEPVQFDADFECANLD